MTATFPVDLLSNEDYAIIRSYLKPLRKITCLPDLVIAPDGDPYLYRWHLMPYPGPGLYLHVQVKSDPERPLHDHPWDNMTTMLAGAYMEEYCEDPEHYPLKGCTMRRKGDVVFRKATLAHRLILPEGVPYAMTLFAIGTKVRSWGYWYPDGWHDWRRHVEDRDGISIHTNRGEQQ